LIWRLRRQRDTLVDNWGTTGVDSYHHPFDAVYTKSESVFRSDIEKEAREYSVPAQVGVRMADLPSQGYANKGGHSIAVVGYDNTNYYYVDTCWRQTTCGFGPKTMSHNYSGGTTVNWAWRIGKKQLFESMLSEGAGYIKDNGMYADRVIGR
jgi:hypothetical protein